MSSQSRLQVIHRSLSARHAKDCIFFEACCGPAWGRGHTPRADFVAVARSWAKPCITIYEIKTSVADFRGDDKWRAYLPYCHRFYFAVPLGMISPKDVPDPAGLVVCSGKGARLVKKPVLRPIEIPTDLVYGLLINRHKNGEREEARDIGLWPEWKAEAYRDLLEQKELGRDVGFLVAKKIREISREKERLARVAEDAEKIQKLRGILQRRYNVNLWGEGWMDKLVAALDGDININIESPLIVGLTRIRDTADSLIAGARKQREIQPAGKNH